MQVTILGPPVLIPVNKERLLSGEYACFRGPVGSLCDRVP